MFKFRMDGILRINEYKEKKCREELGKCIKKLKDAQEEESRLINEIKCQNEENKKESLGKLSVDRLILRKGFLTYLFRELRQKQKYVEECQKELALSRERLLAAMKERKKFEKLKNKKYEKYLEEMNKREQAVMDELAVFKK